MKCLVTGGAGFIGSHICDALVKKGAFVRVIDNFITGKKEYLEGIKKNIHLIEGDIRDNEVLKRAVKGVDVIFHQAALRSVERSVEDPLMSHDVNASGTLNLLMVAKQMSVKRVVYASSSSVYGLSKRFPQKEDDPAFPISPYAVSKLDGENYCRVFARSFGLETVSLRYFNVFGSRQDPRSKYALVIPKFIKELSLGKALEIHGDGKQSRDFTYVGNVVNANLLAAKVRGISGEVFNIGCGQTHSIIDVAECLAELMGKKASFKYEGERTGDVRRTFASIKKAKKMLSYSPQITLEKGLKKTVEWFQKAGKKNER